MQELTLSPDLCHLPAVRAWVRDAVAAAGVSERQAAVLDLLTTELVSNAVRHGEGQVRVQAGVEGDQVVVTVHDTGPGTPSARSVTHDAEGGRGLALVGMLAATWGVTVHPDPDHTGPDDAGPAPASRGGKTVWFGLAADA